MKLGSLVINLVLLGITISIVCIMIVKRFIYFRPTRELLFANETYENIRHHHITARWFMRDSDYTILFCGDNTGNLSYKQHKVNGLLSIGYSVLAFDYAGFGESKGTPSEQGFYDDAATMTGFLVGNMPAANIIAYGEGVGCAVAASVARRLSLPCVILDEPVPSIAYSVVSSKRLISLFSRILSEFDLVKQLEGIRSVVIVLRNGNNPLISSNSWDMIKAHATKLITYNNPNNMPWEILNDLVGELVNKT